LFLWGSASELKTAQELKNRFEHSLVVEKLSLPGLQNLMASVDFVVAMDSLPLHLAGTTETPAFGIFGASSAQKYMPQGNAHFAFQGSCPYGRVFERRCPILRTCPTGSCIRDLQGKELFDFIRARARTLPFP
jgi:heptosyltransferase-1